MRQEVKKADAPAAAAPAAAPAPSFDDVCHRIVKALDGVDIPSTIRLTIEQPTEGYGIGKGSPETEAILAKHMPVIKTDEERFVLGIVLEPTLEMAQPDSQRDVYSAAEVRKASYKFMEDFQVMGLQHRADVSDRVRVLLNWIALDDATINGQPVTKGTWLMGVRVQDDQLWQDVKDGKITGFSIGGFANRMPAPAPATATVAQ